MSSKSTINPGSNAWSVTPTGITVSGKTKKYATYQELLNDRAPGTLGWVVNASGDPTVNEGSALYSYNSETGTWTKIYEAESMDQELNVEVSWSTITDGPESSADDIDAAVTNTHTHTNKTLLDGFSLVGSDLKFTNGSSVVTILTGDSNAIASMNESITTNANNITTLNTTVNNIPNNYYTKTQVDQLIENIDVSAQTHIHNNKDVIDKITYDSDTSMLKYDGTEIVLSTSLTTTLNSYRLKTDSISYNELADVPDLSVYAKTGEIQYSSLQGLPDLSQYITRDESVSVTWDNLSGKPSFATVATSGSYNDLTNRPTLTDYQLVSDMVNYLSTSDANLWGKLTGVPSTFTPSSHTHTKSEITDWPAEDAGGYGLKYNIDDDGIVSLNASDWTIVSSKGNTFILPAQTTSGTVFKLSILPSAIADTSKLPKIVKNSAGTEKFKFNGVETDSIEINVSECITVILLSTGWWVIEKSNL